MKQISDDRKQESQQAVTMLQAIYAEYLSMPGDIFRQRCDALQLAISLLQARVIDAECDNE